MPSTGLACAHTCGCALSAAWNRLRCIVRACCHELPRRTSASGLVPLRVAVGRSMPPCCFRFIKRYLIPIACIEAAILRLSVSCSQSEGRRLSTVSHNATNHGTSSWNVACQRHLQQFLTSTLCTGESSRGPIAQSLRAGDGVVNSLSTCIAAYTEEQHKQILSKIVQARRDQYVQLSSASDLCSTDPVVFAYISMLNEEVVSMPGIASTPHLLSNIRLAAEILHPVSAVCWPWPARTCAASAFPLGTDKEAAAMTLIHAVKGAMGRRQVMPTEVVTTDAMLAVALCSHMTDATVASELITQRESASLPQYSMLVWPMLHVARHKVSQAANAAHPCRCVLHGRTVSTFFKPHQCKRAQHRRHGCLVDNHINLSQCIRHAARQTSQGCASKHQRSRV